MKGDLFTAMNEGLAAEAGSKDRPTADIALTLGRIRARVGQAEEAEKSLLLALELAKKEKNWQGRIRAGADMRTMVVSQPIIHTIPA